MKIGSFLPLAFTLTATTFADGTETLGAPSIDFADGRLVLAGTSLADPTGLIQVDLPQGAVVRQVVAYWDGLDQPADVQGDFDTLALNGTPITGMRIGGATNFIANYFASGYRADVTHLDLVGPGSSSVLVTGHDFTYSTNGLALAIVLADEDTHLEVRDGLDFAHGRFAAPYDAVAPMTYTFEPSTGAREVAAHLIVGGVGESRPSVVEVRIDGEVVLEQIDVLGGNVGAEFDIVDLEFTLPAGATDVAVQLISEDRGGSYAGSLVSSFTWLFSGLEISEPSGVHFGAHPFWWVTNLWRWDAWNACGNVTQTVHFTDRFNQRFGVTRKQSGMRNSRRLWHGLMGRGSYCWPMRRMLNREAVAALANADSPDMNFPFTPDEVKSLYRNAVGAEEGEHSMSAALQLFRAANRLGNPF
ncbi:MAG: hypothetical protein GY711_28905 [bacterium]|nr:hypothetical protein [bacterium]